MKITESLREALLFLLYLWKEIVWKDDGGIH